MSENFKIGNYNYTINEIYSSPNNVNMTDGNLNPSSIQAKNKTSEDELAEFTDEETNSSSENYSISKLQKQYKKEMENMQRYQDKLSEYRKIKNEIKNKLILADADNTSNLETKLDNIQEKIDTTNSKLSDCISKMSALNTSILNEQNNILAQIQSDIQSSQYLQPLSYSNTNMQNVNGITPVNTNLNVQQGSGTSLMGVTGELSVCLDRVAQSLGTSRQDAADYITTLCNTVGEGKVNPKIMLSQIFSESSGNQSCTTTATSKFVGLGQMSSVAVKEINNQYGTNFTFQDMDNPAKNLEAMTYLMKYQLNRYNGNMGAALTAYNVGHFSGSVNGYAQKIMSRAGS